MLQNSYTRESSQAGLHPGLPFTSHLTFSSWSLCFLICKMGVIPASPSQGTCQGPARGVSCKTWLFILSLGTQTISVATQAV